MPTAELTAGETEEAVEAAPERADVAAPVISYDDELLAVEQAGDDYRITPLASFESTAITVEADVTYVVDLLNYQAPGDVVSYPAQRFEAHVDGMAVYVTADEGAFPEGTSMAVAPVYDEATLDGITDTVEDGSTVVKQVHAVDITFYDGDGREIEPLIPISVVMNVEALAQAADAVVVHMDDAGNAEVVEQTAPESDADAAVAFDAEAFSVYAVVVTEKYISADGQSWNIQVTYGADAGIPEGATLSVSEMTDGSYLARANRTMGMGAQITYARFLTPPSWTEAAPSSRFPPWRSASPCSTSRARRTPACRRCTSERKLK